MLKILVNYSSCYFDDINECDCYVGNNKLLGFEKLEESEDIQLVIDDWFRKVFYKNTKLKHFSFRFDNVSDYYDEYINTDKNNPRHHILLKKLHGNKTYILIK